MSTLYIRLPFASVADSASHWLCPYALVSARNKIEREGIELLSNLSETISKTQRIVLLLNSSNVTLLRLQIPPLSAVNLKAALPGLVEEHLLCDPDECAIVAGDSFDGLRTIAVMQRTLLDFLAGTFSSLGAKRISALPAQLCLPWQSGRVTAAISETALDMALRLSEQESLGLAISVDQDESIETEAIQTLCAMVPEAQITLYVPQVQAYRQAIDDAGDLNGRIQVFADNWSHWIAGADITKIDLMTGLGAENAPRLDLRPWRWPLALAAAVLLINAAVLNIDWWRLKRQTSALRASMTQIYKSAYPKESVILDPLAQMRQKIAIARHDSGQATPDDFVYIAAAAGAALSNLATGNIVAELEYRDHALFVQLKPDMVAPTQQMKAELAKQDFTLELTAEQAGAQVWKIRSVK